MKPIMLLGSKIVPRLMDSGVRKLPVARTLQTGRGISQRFFSAESQKPDFVCKIVFDGSCPVCSKAVKMLNIKDAELINARDGNDATVRSLEAKGVDLDKGMAVVYPNGDVHVGADAVAAMGQQKGGLFATVMGSNLMRDIYPSLKGVRNALVDEQISEQRARESVESESRSMNKKI